MARRKRQFMEDDDDSSSGGSENDDGDFTTNDPDLREERALFNDPYQRKRRRKNGKEDAIYGVFGEDSDDEPRPGRFATKGKTSDLSKAPAFVSGHGKTKQVDLDEEMQVNVENENEEESDGSMHDEEEDSSESDDEDDDDDVQNDSPKDAALSPSPPAHREPSVEEVSSGPRIGGIGFAAKTGGGLDFSAAKSGGGLGFGKGGIGSSGGGLGSSKGGIGSSSGGLGFGKGGIGSSTSAASGGASIGSAFSKSATQFSSDIPQSSSADTLATKKSEEPSEEPTIADNVPIAFGNSNRAQRSFLRAADTPTPRGPAVLSADDRAHFSKLTATFGARMLQKMGWESGTGLGPTGEGIVTPVESKLRPQKMGIAFKGFKEKTAQAKAEARRRGEVVSDDEEERKKKRAAKKAGAKGKGAEQRQDAWKKKKVKTKIQHKTYEEIVAEAGQETGVSGIGQIIDATGAVPREVSSLAEISTAGWAPSADPTRIPEIRHNLRLIVDDCTHQLDGLAREAKSLEERKKFIASEDLRLRKAIENEAELIARLQQVNLVVDEISTQARELASIWEATLEPFQPSFQKLIGQYGPELDRYRLDEVIVAAIAPVFRRMVAAWSPLEDPTAFIPIFRSWRPALKTNAIEAQPDNQVDLYGARAAPPPQIEKPMTPFESLLWSVWLPKVRSCINNDWQPSDPHPAVRLYETWSSFVPPFIRDNLLDQLIIPKVHKAVAEWNTKTSKVPLQTLVFPWLPHLGLRLEDFVGDARRKVKQIFRAWVIGEGDPGDMLVWKEVFDAGEWDSMLLKYVVPKLGVTLRDDFRINPRQQDLKPLHAVFAWFPLIRPAIMAQLISAAFFPKWLDVMHVWLIQPKVSFAEVANWYEKWSEQFPEGLRTMPDVQEGFTGGLQMMNTALELGPDAPTKLPKPDHHRRASTPEKTVNGKSKAAAVRPSARTQEITFKSIVEEFAASHNLLFIPTGRAHELAQMPLYRVSATADGKGGVMVYLLDDAVWAAPTDGGELWRPIDLEEMVLRANSR